MTSELVGADLRNLVNEAALLAARRDASAVAPEDFSSALEKIVLGSERKLVMTEEDWRRVAYHEAGHALMALLLPEADPIHKVSIVPRGRALGVTYQLPLGDRHNYGKRFLEARVVITLGGAAAEQVTFGDGSTGAEHDIKAATETARQMVMQWGMSERVGLIHAAGGEHGLSAGPVENRGGAALERAATVTVIDELASAIDEETKRIVQGGFDRASRLLQEQTERVRALATALLEQETLDGAEIREAAGIERRSGTAAALAGHAAGRDVDRGGRRHAA